MKYRIRTIYAWVRMLFWGMPGMVLLITALPVSAFAQGDISVTGQVTSLEEGEPLPGVNIVVKGTQRGTTTNSDGQYEISVPNEQTVLVFSSVGFESREIVVGGRSTINVRLKGDIQLLSDLVVVGYGTQRKQDVTSAISSVSAEELAQETVTNIDQALQGRVAGVNVTQNDGTPGGSISVQVRGIGTIGNSDPLYVIDGIPGGDLNSINPDNIQSIEILKDASAAAIYGANGANGVVLVTTKSGQTGNAQVNFDITYGYQQLGNKMDMLNATQYAELQNEARRNSGLEENWDNPSGLGGGTDWQEELTRKAPLQKYNLSVSGGNENLTYFISGGYFDQTGTMIGSSFDRASIRANAEYQISDKFKVGNKLSLARTNQADIPTDYPFATDNRIVGALEMSPTVPVFRDGQYAGPQGDFEGSSQGPNPVGLARLNDVKSTGSNVVERAYLEYDLLENLRIRTELGIDFSYSEYKEFHPTYRWDITSNSIAFLYRGNSNFYGWTSQSTAEYNTSINQDNELKLLGGFSVSEGRYEEFNAEAQGFASEDVTVLSAADQINSLSEYIEEESSLSVFGRLNYAFKDKYLFTGNIRVDGSSKFGPGNRYGTFPSFSVGWRLSQEPFLADVDFISEMKLRASWGKAGNSNISNYAYTSRLDLSQYYVFGNNQNANTGVAPVNAPNEDIKWETTTQQDIGLDVSMFEDRLSVTADYYIKDTKDMLVPVPIPGSSGITEAPFQNAGKVRNRGFELTMNYRNSLQDFTYDLGLNFSTIHNEVLDLGGGLPIGSPILYRESVRLTRTVDGRAIASFYGYVTDGLFQDQQEIDNHASQPGAQPGDIRFKDLNSDGLIDDNDRDYIGNPIPDYTFGFSLGASYKNFDFKMLLNGVYGNELMNTLGYRLLNGSHVGNKMAGVLDRWTGPGTSNSMPRMTWNDPNNNVRISDRYVEDGSYLRLKNIQLGYNLSAGSLDKIGARTVRIYVSAQNLLTFTSYNGLDPELGKVDNNNLNYGIDMGNYPVARAFNLGLNVGF